MATSCYNCGSLTEDSEVFCSANCQLTYEAEHRAEARFQQNDFERRNTPKENR